MSAAALCLLRDFIRALVNTHFMPECALYVCCVLTRSSLIVCFFQIGGYDWSSLHKWHMSMWKKVLLNAELMWQLWLCMTAFLCSNVLFPTMNGSTCNLKMLHGIPCCTSRSFTSVRGKVVQIIWVITLLLATLLSETSVSWLSDTLRVLDKGLLGKWR